MKSILSVQEELRDETRPLKVFYISSYIPRRCGIATFTKDLTSTINPLNPLFKAGVAAMDNHVTDGISYPSEVKYRIGQDKWDDYRRVARYINYYGHIDVVNLQHEFGLYGGDAGEMVIPLVESIKKPIVTTLHTVLAAPSEKQKIIIKKISRESTYVVVMLEEAQKLLIDEYGVKPEKIVVIHHGVPDFPRLDPVVWKRNMRLSGREVMTSSNLLSESKGIEYAILALPRIVRRIPNFLYLVLGQTHPVYLADRGGHDLYRAKLHQLVTNMGVRKNVRFVNRYLSKEELIAYIGASDYYVTPYLNPQQAASGALAYAIGAGKVCISTPYLYAREMLAGGRGMLVPFKDADAIGRVVVNLYRHPKRRMELESKAYEIGRTMMWSNIAHQYFHLFHFVLDRKHHAN